MNFVGRNKELKIIEDFVFKSKTPILYLYGMRGIGKTALLYYFIEKNKKQLKDNYAYFYGFDFNSNLTNLITDNKNLIIIDDFETSPNESSSILKELVDRNPKKRIILSSSQAPLIKETDVVGRTKYLELAGLQSVDLDKMIKERLSNIDEIDNSIKQRLLDYFNYNPRLLLTSLNYLVHNRNISIEELIGLIENPLKQSGLVDINGRPLSRDSENIKQIENKIIVVNNSLIDKAYSDPDFVYKIRPHQFEELVAELLEKEGFKVNLTKKTHDGGKDIFVAQNNTLGNFLYYIECKQFTPTNHVGVKFVRELYGTISADRATAGLLVTTSYFSKEAKDFVENVQNQLSLKGYLELKKWIREIYLKTNNGA